MEKERKSRNGGKQRKLEEKVGGGCQNMDGEAEEGGTT